MVLVVGAQFVCCRLIIIICVGESSVVVYVVVVVVVAGWCDTADDFRKLAGRQSSQTSQLPERLLGVD